MTPKEEEYDDDEEEEETNIKHYSMLAYTYIQERRQQGEAIERVEGGKKFFFL